MKDIYLIDGSALIYRSFYAIRDLRTSSGQLTNAIYGFATTLIKIIRDRNPEHMCVFFDLKAPTHRHDAFAGYKAHRKPMPDELVAQLPHIKQLTSLLGIRYMEKEGYEADDLIATFAERLKKENRIFIVTGDKDIMQVLDENVTMVNPDGWKTFSAQDFTEKYGLQPEKMADIIGLAGDASDNIPGVPGIGEKTALKLLKDYGSLENLLENLDSLNSEKIRKKLEENRENAIFSKKLAILHRDVETQAGVNDIKICSPDIRELFETFERFEFRKLAGQLKELYPSILQMCPREDVITFPTGESITMDELKENPGKYRGALEDEQIPKYGFNLKDFVNAAARKNVSLANPYFDFAIARHLTGKVITESDPLSLARQYAKELKELGMEELFHNVEMPLVRTLAWMELNGIKADIQVLHELNSELEGELRVLENRIYQSAGEVFNINSPQQLSSILFEKLKLPAKRRIKTGFSTDTGVLKELAELHPLPGLIFEYRELFKLKSTYVNGLVPFIDSNTGRIYPTFSQISTSTGRLSCSNPNLQNIPVRTDRGSRIRKAFRCEEGNVLYSFDYSQIELRVLADFSGDPCLVNGFRNDRDIHTETADILFSGVSLFSPCAEMGEIKDRRRIAKIINFGIIYGMSAYGLSKELNIPVSAADAFISEYFARFSGVKKYLDRIVTETEKNGYASTLLKRRRYFPEMQSGDKNRREFARRAAINMPIQGSAADLMKLAMNRIHEYFLKEKLKSRMVLQIHDELLFEVVPEEERRIAENVKPIMENVMQLKVPLKADVKKGLNYLDMCPV